MDDRLRLRRHLYAQLARTTRRGRRALRRQIALLGAAAPPPGAGSSGVREPRRPLAPRGPAGRRFAED